MIFEGTELTVPELVKKIEGSSTCHFLFIDESRRMNIRVDGNEEIYYSPDIRDLSDEDFKLLTDTLEKFVKEEEDTLEKFMKEEE
jgi:hypothetical protein